MSPFDEIDEHRLRTGHGVKWGSLESDVIGAWVADMDFGIPPAVADAIEWIVRSGGLGYPHWPDGNPAMAAFEQRMHDQFDWTPTPGRVRVHTDLIQAVQLWIEQATDPGDGIAVHVPTYPPFLASIHGARRTIIPIDLTNPIDQPGAAATLHHHLAASNTRMIVLCNPHNPTGHCFTRPELEALADVVADLDLTVVSDEVHADLVYDPHRHIPFASIGPDAAQRTITITSATKSYNLAAIRLAVSHVGPERIWNQISAAPSQLYGVPSTIAVAATIAAWTRCDEWFRDLTSVLNANRTTMEEWAAQRGWITDYHSPDGTYLAWLDVSEAGLGTRPAETIERVGRVKLGEGADFSRHTDIDTAHFVRLNFATSSDNLHRIIQRIDDTVEHR